MAKRAAKEKKPNWRFDLDGILATQRKAHNAHPYPSYDERVAKLKKLGAVIAANETAFQETISNLCFDLGY